MVFQNRTCLLFECCPGIINFCLHSCRLKTSTPQKPKRAERVRWCADVNSSDLHPWLRLLLTLTVLSAPSPPLLTPIVPLFSLHPPSPLTSPPLLLLLLPVKPPEIQTFSKQLPDTFWKNVLLTYFLTGRVFWRHNHHSPFMVAYLCNNPISP